MKNWVFGKLLKDTQKILRRRLRPADSKNIGCLQYGGEIYEIVDSKAKFLKIQKISVFHIGDFGKIVEIFEKRNINNNFWSSKSTKNVCLNFESGQKMVENFTMEN